MTDTPRQYGCLHCRRVLNRFQLPDGTVSYRHGLEELIGFAHQPVPRRADRIPGGVIAACDFCSAEDANAWLFHTQRVGMIAAGPDVDLVNDYGTRWGACPACAELVSSADLDALHARVLAVSGLPAGDIAAIGARAMLAATLSATLPGRTLTADGTHGPVPDLAPRLLPKFRDRLAVLLGEPNRLPSLDDDPQGQAELADGLLVSRMYVLDELFTQQSAAAAGTLADATIASVPVAAPYGLLLFDHPLGAHGSVAYSWITDRATGNIRLAWYRPLATTLTRTQVQKLREQAGWLTPIGQVVLAPHDPVDAGHPAAVLFAAWLFIAHRLAEAAPIPVDPAVRKSYARTGRPAPEVYVIRLRGQRRDQNTQPEQPSPGPRLADRGKPDHRFFVPPFIRNQRHGPGRSLIKTVVIWGYINGPKGLPVRASTAVRLLAAPKPARQR